MTVSITTASKGSKILGISSIVGFVVLVLLAFFVTEPDIRFHPDTGEEFGQFDAVRLLYLHVPMAVSYTHLTLPTKA